MVIENRIRAASTTHSTGSTDLGNRPEMDAVHKGPELWGGVESTVNRVHDAYFDQTERTGHAHRSQDIEAFATLGVTSLRYPVLWERCQPGPNLEPNWHWTDERLTLIQANNMRPIAGLLHHGSGP